MKEKRCFKRNRGEALAVRKQEKTAIQNLPAILLLWGICFCIIGCQAKKPPLSVNGEAVSEQELALLDEDMDLAVRMKILQQWVYEEKITEEPFSYEKMLEELEEENQSRKEKKEAGEVVYGVTEYTPVQFYYAKMGEYERMLKDTVMQNASEEEQKKWYQVHLDAYREFGEICAEVKVLQDQVVVREEEISLTSDNYRTLSEQNEELVLALTDMSEGEERNWTDAYGQEWNVVCMNRAEGRVPSFEEVKGAVSEQYASEKLETELMERIERSKVEVSENRNEKEKNK